MRRICYIRLRVVVYILASLLLMLAGLISLVGVKDAYAQSGCILFCPPTPTPSPTPSPTPGPTPSSTPRPRPSPTPRPSATAKPDPTVTAGVSPTPTVVPTEVAPTPAENSAHTPPLTRKSNGNQAGKNGLLHFVVIAGIIFFMLLLGLEIGWLVVRRALLPPVSEKIPPSGARPWSRFRVPNPNSLIPGSRAGNAPASGSAFWAYDSPGGYAADIVASGPSSGHWQAQQDVTSDVDTDRILPARDNSNSSNNSSNNTLALARGGAPGWPGHSRRKKGGLITRAPYYSGLAPTDENE